WHLKRTRPSSWSIFWSLLWNRLKIMTTWPPYMFMVMVLLFIITLFIFHVGYTWIIGAKWKTIEATWSKVQSKHISAGVTDGQNSSNFEATYKRFIYSNASYFHDFARNFRYAFEVTKLSAQSISNPGSKSRNHSHHYNI